jgi:hypothetical protein
LALNDDAVKVPSFGVSFYFAVESRARFRRFKGNSSMLSFRIAVAAILFMGLSACLFSQAPLITADIADYPIADGAKFTQTRLNVGDAASVTMIVRREGDLYAFEEVKAEGDPDTFRGRLKEIAPDVFLSMGMQKDSVWLYGAYVRKGETFLEYGPTCSEFEDLAKAAKRSISEFGATKSEGESDCQFTTLDDVSKAMLFMIEAGLQANSGYAPVK